MLRVEQAAIRVVLHGGRPRSRRSTVITRIINGSPSSQCLITSTVRPIRACMTPMETFLVFLATSLASSRLTPSLTTPPIVTGAAPSPHARRELHAPCVTGVSASSPATFRRPPGGAFPHPLGGKWCRAISNHNLVLPSKRRSLLLRRLYI